MIPPLVPFFARQHLTVMLEGANTFASDVVVYWTEIIGGDPDPGTGGNIGGVEVQLSGTMRGYGYEEPAKNLPRMFAEIQTGDLILDLAADPQVTLPPGQMVSGAKPLQELEGKGLRYRWDNRYYTSKEVSPDLQAAWDAYLGNRRVSRTLLLKRQT